jgi:hypothetical protein
VSFDQCNECANCEVLRNSGSAVAGDAAAGVRPSGWGIIAPKRNSSAIDESLEETEARSHPV